MTFHEYTDHIQLLLGCLKEEKHSSKTSYYKFSIIKISYCGSSKAIGRSPVIDTLFIFGVISGTLFTVLVRNSLPPLRIILLKHTLPTTSYKKN
jgi:hypothetical protein